MRSTRVFLVKRREPYISLPVLLLSRKCRREERRIVSETGSRCDSLAEKLRNINQRPAVTQALAMTLAVRPPTMTSVTPVVRPPTMTTVVRVQNMLAVTVVVRPQTMTSVTPVGDATMTVLTPAVREVTMMRVTLVVRPMTMAVVTPVFRLPEATMAVIMTEVTAVMSAERMAIVKALFPVVTYGVRRLR